MRIFDGLLWVAFLAAWLLVFIVGLFTGADSGQGFWVGVHQEHHILLMTAVALTGARITWSYGNWKDRHDATR